MVVLALGCAMHAASAAAQAVIIRMTGPQGARLKPGAIIRPGEQLKAGEKVTLLGRSGTLVFSGPDVLTADKLAGKALTATPLPGTTAAPDKHAKVAAVRSTGQVRKILPSAAGPSDIWSVVPGEEGTHCLPKGSLPEFWRSDVRGEKALIINGQDGGQLASAQWRGGEAWLVWPAAKGPAPFKTYKFVTGGVTTELQFVHLDPEWSSVRALEQALADHDCSAQVRRLHSSGDDF